MNQTLVVHVSLALIELVATSPRGIRMGKTDPVVENAAGCCNADVGQWHCGECIFLPGLDCESVPFCR